MHRVPQRSPGTIQVPAESAASFRLFFMVQGLSEFRGRSYNLFTILLYHEFVMCSFFFFCRTFRPSHRHEGCDAPPSGLQRLRYHSLVIRWPRFAPVAENNSEELTKNEWQCNYYALNMGSGSVHFLMYVQIYPVSRCAKFGSSTRIIGESGQLKITLI